MLPSSQVVLKVDAVISLSAGLIAYIFPSQVLQLFLKEETDGIHWHLCRVVAAILIGQAVSAWRFASSKQKHVHSSFFVARIMSSTLILIAGLHAKAHFGSLFTSQAFPFVFAAGVATLLFYILKLLTSGWEIGENLVFRDQRIFNSLLQLDSFAALMIGLVWLAFPDWLLHRQVTHKLFGSHFWLGRCFGAFLSSTHLITNHSIYFKAGADRRSMMIARVLQNGCCFFAQVYSQYALHDWWSSGHWVGTGLFGFWTVLVFLVASNAFFGSFK